MLGIVANAKVATFSLSYYNLVITRSLDQLKHAAVLSLDLERGAMSWRKKKHLKRGQRRRLPVRRDKRTSGAQERSPVRLRRAIPKKDQGSEDGGRACRPLKEWLLARVTRHLDSGMAGNRGKLG